MKKTINKILLTAGVGSLALFMVLSTSPAIAADAYTLFGEASYVAGNASPRGVETNSDSTAPGYGGIDFTVPSGLTVADLDTLSTDYKVTVGGIGGGSPRFVAEVDTLSGTEYILFYIGGLGPTPADNTWYNSGNIASPTSLVDVTGGVYQYQTPYSGVQTSMGSYPVTGIWIVTDAGWAVSGGTQTVVFDNSMINTMVYDYELAPVIVPANKDECKNDGWKTFTNPSFKNQGECVSWTNHQ